MSAAAAAKAAPDASAADGAAAVAPARGKKKLILVVTLVLALAAAGAGAALFMMKKRAAAAAEAAEEEGAETKDDKREAKQTKVDVKNAPTFVPLDPFTVNLADREAERYVQVGMTLELADPKAGDLLKAYMPAIRNNILLALASKTAGQLMEHEGKMLLAEEVRAAALKPLGYAIKAPAPAASGVSKASKPHAEEDAPPIRAVHFSNFIIQ